MSHPFVAAFVSFMLVSFVERYHLCCHLLFCSKLISDSMYVSVSFIIETKCLQCFDAVGWVAGKASVL